MFGTNPGGKYVYSRQRCKVPHQSGWQVPLVRELAITLDTRKAGLDA